MDLTVLLPAIRTTLWDNFYDSLAKSCTKYTWELVLSSPFELTPYLQVKNNVKLVKEFGCPSRAAQLALFEVDGNLIYHTVDDALFNPGSIDKAIEQYRALANKKAVVNMRYREGMNFGGTELPPEYWTAWHHKDLMLPGIPKEYRTSLHHMMDRDYMLSLGGWDCRFEYLVHPCLDLMFRVQADGGFIVDSEQEITSCDHMPGHTGDHGPIHDAQTIHDYPIFYQMYATDNASKRIHVDINNWSQQPSIWARRFQNKIPKVYKDLL
jgi:hypothetical protein